MESIQGGAGASLNRRNTSFALDNNSTDTSQIKSDYALLCRKYERLVSKEKRMQVKYKSVEYQGRNFWFEVIWK